MKKLINKIFHSDNLAISCIKRFIVLFCVWIWNVWSLYSLYTYPPMHVYTKLKYEAESLAIHTIFFFTVFLSICMVDAFWVKESKERNISKYIVRQIIPMIPFLVICPVLYNIYPDKNLSNIFLAVQWLQVIITDSLLWGSILTAGIVVLIVILFFVVPFLLLPRISASVKRLYEKIRFCRLKKRYTKSKKIKSYPVRLFAEIDGELSVCLQNICDIFNESVQSCFEEYDCGSDDAKMGIFFTEAGTDSIEYGTNGVFAVVRVGAEKIENVYDTSLIADKCVNSIVAIIKDSSSKLGLESADCLIEHILKTADAFYPKDSGLKRL